MHGLLYALTPPARRERIPAILHPPSAMTQLIAIHANGAGASTLRDEYRRVRKLANETADALSDATCSGLDFYLQGPEAFRQDQADRREMFRLLQLVQDYASQWEARAAEHLRG